MKKITFLAIMLIITNVLFSQSIKDLDNKNGFKDFKLSDSYSLWEDDLIFLNNIGNDTKLYNYEGNCCEKLFEYDIAKIALIFKENKLVSLRITTRKLQESKDVSGKSTEYYGKDAQSINSSLAFLFGEPTSKRVPENSSAVFYDWESENILLISKYDFLGTFSGDQMEITIGLKSYIFRNIKNGF